MSAQKMGVLYTDSLPAKVWREIAKQTTNLEFRAQIRDELSKHSPNDTLRIRIDHIIEQQPPAPRPGEVTITVPRHTAEQWLWMFTNRAPLLDFQYDELTEALHAAFAAAAHDREAGDGR